MTNNSIFTRVLALMLCLIMLVGTLTACLNQVDHENHVGTTTNGGVVTTDPTTKPTTTTTTTPTTGDVVEDDPIEEPVDPNEVFSASTDILSDGLIYGTLASDVVIGGAEMGALVPADVKVEAGASNLALSVKKVDEVLLSDALSTLDVHINGVALDNTVPMIVKLGAILEAGLGATELKLYHTENGVDNLMTRVNSPSDFAIHNQYYYNAETGEVTIYVASFSVFTAVQSTASKWEDGTVADTSWYNENDAEFTLKDVADFLGFRDLVDAGNTFAGKTVKLGTDIDLNNKLFNPIGGGWAYNGGKTFNGTFDGGNHTIYNLRVNGWELDETGDKHSGTSMGAGLFSSIHNATIRNLAVVGSELIVETTSIGIIAGDAQGKCTFENIVVSDATLGNYQMRNGGIVGDIYVIESDNVPEGEYSHTFTNIVVDSSVKLSSMWGDFDTGNGGVIGGKYGSSKVLMENVTVACELDVFSDVTAAYQWYAYRRCGMLVGYTGQNSPKQATNAAADFLTCKNVNVYYGDWVNYTYYQFTNQDISWQSNYPWVRAQESDYNGPFSNVRYGNPVVGDVAINTPELAEANKTGFAAITFNQLYGGGQGVYGTADHEKGGVTVHNTLTKTVYINNNLGWENLTLYYWFANGNDTWTTLIDGIKLTEENGVYRVDVPAYAYGFVILADGENVSDTFVLAELEENETVKLGCTHESTTIVKENVVGATCGSAGSYEEVTKCAECGKEISRETVATDKLAHTAGEAVKENEKASTCTVAGSYDSVVYCSVCKAEISREKVTLELAAHTVVTDKAVAATCTTAGKTEGSHCSVCNAVIKAQTTVAALGHNWNINTHKCSVCGVSAPTKTIYFKNEWVWSDVRIYYWYTTSSGTVNNTMPGTKMTKVDNDGTYDYYTYEVPEYLTGIIILDASQVAKDGSIAADKKTPDILLKDIEDNEMFYMFYNSSATIQNQVKSEDYTSYKAQFKVIYLDLSVSNGTEWRNDSAWFAAYVWGSGNAWYAMSDIDGDKIYSCWIPTKYTNVIFCRMNPNKDINSGWDGKWNQTIDLTIGSNNCYKITNAWNGTDGKAQGSWSKK